MMDFAVLPEDFRFSGNILNCHFLRFASFYFLLLWLSLSKPNQQRREGRTSAKATRRQQQQLMAFMKVAAATAFCHEPSSTCATEKEQLKQNEDPSYGSYFVDN